MRDLRALPIAITELLRIVRSRPGITTLDLAEALNVPPDIARWAVHQSGVLEYYDGWHIREKGGAA